MSSGIKEIALLLPDSLLFGSFLLGITTLSIQHMTLFFTLLESLVLYTGLNELLSHIVGKTPPSKCNSKFYTLFFQDLHNSSSANNISYGVYIITVACSYLLKSFYGMQHELHVLDAEYTNIRTITAMVLIVFAYSMTRVWLSCDSMSSVILALVFGGLIGMLIQYQNTHIFGRDTVNFLGIPLIRNKSATGEPIYICN